MVRDVNIFPLFTFSLLLALLFIFFKNLIAHCVSQGEMKMPVCIEDECNPDLPPASLLFRSARQYAYGVLFSLAETQRRLERMAMRKRTPLEGECGTESEAYNECGEAVIR